MKDDEAVEVIVDRLVVEIEKIIGDAEAALGILKKIQTELTHMETVIPCSP